MDSLIEPIQLWEQMQHDPNLVLLGMTPPLRHSWRHIQGSRQVWRPQIGANGGSRLVDAASFQAWAQGLGLSNSSSVVIWDRRYDATRLWWAFQRYGSVDVRVLDGGLQAWCMGQLPIKRGWSRASRPTDPSSFRVSASNRFPCADLAEVLSSEMNPDVQLWDCRSASEWSGRTRLRGARKAGRIPWAKHLPWQLFRNDRRRDRRFRSTDQIQAVIKAYGLNPAKRQLFYCQSGVRTTVPMLALSQIGWDPAALINYDGSWREWSQCDGLPWVSDD